ncbi:hypothetical protein CRUP_036616 [Coryphaenoides rupestris]|nr:hypothetical protein CRUP_036616 [Coryphaenoides rupestris]
MNVDVWKREAGEPDQPSAKRSRTEALLLLWYAPLTQKLAGFQWETGSINLSWSRGRVLTAAIVFLSLGIMASFLCLLIDGVFIVFNIDIRPLKAGRCQFYTSGSGYIYENYHASVPCRNLEESCSVTVRSGTCYCCDLYDCAK